MPKRSIRAQFLAERKSCSADFCADSSLKIQQRLLGSDAFLRASSLAIYSSVRNEVLTGVVAKQALASGKTLVYPRVCGDDLEFVEVSALQDLTPGAFGVLEPIGQTIHPVELLDMVIVPGVVFDRVGHRLGYGRGFYDRTLSRCSADCVKVGFAYDFQVVDALPAADHDEMLSMLITESSLLNFPPDKFTYSGVSAKTTPMRR